MHVPCHIYTTGSIMYTAYASIHIVDRQKNAASFAIIHDCENNDIVITENSRLAAMVLAKNAHAINWHGFMYDRKNIMLYLDAQHMRRHAARKTNRQQVRCSPQVTIETKKPYEWLLRSTIKHSRAKPKD